MTKVEEFKAYLDVANGEDNGLVEALHRCSMSPIVPKGTLHPIERNLWQFTRWTCAVLGWSWPAGTAAPLRTRHARLETGGDTPAG